MPEPVCRKTVRKLTLTHSLKNARTPTPVRQIAARLDDNVLLERGNAARDAFQEFYEESLKRYVSLYPVGMSQQETTLHTADFGFATA